VERRLLPDHVRPREHPHVPDAFTPTDGLPSIPLVPAEHYYRPGYIRGADGLELPDDLEESFHLLFALPASGNIGSYGRPTG